MEHLGIDVHKAESQICILTESGEVVERRIRMQRERFAAVLGERPRARVAHFALRKIIEKEIDRSNATVPGDDEIGSRVSWWFAGSARYPSNPSGIT